MVGGADFAKDARSGLMLAKISQWLRLAEMDDAPAPANAPRFLFLSINKRCNLKCVHCSFWHDDDSDRANYLDRDGRRRVLSEFASMNPQGAIVICGGESMLDLDDYFDVCGHARSLGLTCLSVVNGTRIRTPAMAERMILEGPREISISLNSHDRALHDLTRGVAGAFDKAVNALRLLVEARRRLGVTTTKIYVMGLIFDENYRDLEAFYDFVLNDIGADKLKLNFIQPSFGWNEVDHFLADHHRVDTDELAAIIRRCDARFGLGINPLWLDHVKMYLDSLRGKSDLENGWGSAARTRDHICNTYERNVMVDHYGLARLCFSDGFRGEPLREYGDLRRFWTGAGDVRQEMRSCNRLCGISHSVRRISCTLTPASYSLPASGEAKPAERFTFRSFARLPGSARGS
jgi:MoaA/NifB/PqqE/SkfB family radical SAM enzyme